MNFRKIIPVLILLIIMLSITASTATAAVSFKAVCINKLHGIYDETHNNCYIRSDTWPFNTCHPKWDIWHAVGNVAWWVGCVDLRNASISSYPGSSVDLYGSDFSYDPGTCDGLCRVITTGLTHKAKAALGSLPGKVLGKAYVQVLDDDGNPTTGPFKLCFKVKKAKNPAFFRFTGGSWAYYGGFWSGKKYCMYGNTSGNYVLVDQGK